MIIAITGNDQIVRHKKRGEIIAREGGNDHFSMIAIDGESASEADIRSALSARDLFGKATLVIIRGGTSRDEVKDAIESHASDFKTSSDLLIIDDAKILKPMEKIIKENKGEIVICEKKTSVEKPQTLFPLTDACLARDKKNAWLHFVDARTSGFSAEEMHGLLWWQFKTLALVMKTPRKEHAALGISPFVLRKVESASSKYSDADIDRILEDLIGRLHETRRQSKDFFHQLELFILETL